MTTDRTVAKTGRSMKKREIMKVSPAAAPRARSAKQGRGRSSLLGAAGSRTTYQLLLSRFLARAAVGGPYRVRAGRLRPAACADQRRHRPFFGLNLHFRPDLLQRSDHDPVVRL